MGKRSRTKFLKMIEHEAFSPPRSIIRRGRPFRPGLPFAAGHGSVLEPDPDLAEDVLRPESGEDSGRAADCAVSRESPPRTRYPRETWWCIGTMALPVSTGWPG